MAQYAAERKESVVRRMLASPERSIREWSQDTGISVRSLYDWRRKAIQKGSSVVGQSQPSGRQASGAKRTSAQKIAIVAETAIRNEAERAEYCRAHGVDPEEGKAWREAAESALAGGMEKWIGFSRQFSSLFQEHCSQNRWMGCFRI